MISLHIVLYIVAAILFALVALNVQSTVNLLALGLLAWVLTNII